MRLIVAIGSACGRGIRLRDPVADNIPHVGMFTQQAETAQRAIDTNYMAPTGHLACRAMVSDGPPAREP